MHLMMMNCSNEPTPRSLTVGVIDYYVQHYIFPVQFILGVVGNSINLLVLLSSGMKNQANTLLSAMAFADLGFLFCMLPHSLVSFSFFYKSVRFSYFYFLSKTHAVALANMFSTAATFLVLAVSLERFSGVRRPMHTRFQLRDTRIICLIIFVFMLSFALSFYHHVEYNVNITIGCTNVWANFQHISQLKGSSEILATYVRYAKYTQSIIGVAIPVIVVSILNVSLIYILRRREIMPRHHYHHVNSGSTSADTKQPNTHQIPSSSQHNTSQNHPQSHISNQQDFRYSDIGAIQKQERKVTATVIAIVTCFSVTHLPTLGPFIWEQIYSYRGMKPTITFNNVITLLNMLLVSGKVLNFVLFCLSSAHFRRRTIMILNAHLCQGRYQKKYSSMVTSTLPQGGITIMSAAGCCAVGGGVIGDFIGRGVESGLVGNVSTPVQSSMAGSLTLIINAVPSPLCSCEASDTVTGTPDTITDRSVLMSVPGKGVAQACLMNDSGGSTCKNHHHHQLHCHLVSSLRSLLSSGNDRCGRNGVFCALTGSKTQKNSCTNSVNDEFCWHAIVMGDKRTGESHGTPSSNFSSPTKRKTTPLSIGFSPTAVIADQPSSSGTFRHYSSPLYNARSNRSASTASTTTASPPSFLHRFRRYDSQRQDSTGADSFPAGLNYSENIASITPTTGVCHNISLAPHLGTNSTSISTPVTIVQHRTVAQTFLRHPSTQQPIHIPPPPPHPLSSTALIATIVD